MDNKAAKPTEPAPSTTDFSTSIKRNIAKAMLASLTDTKSSINPLEIRTEFVPTVGTAKPKFYKIYNSDHGNVKISNF